MAEKTKEEEDKTSEEPQQEESKEEQQETSQQEESKEEQQETPQQEEPTGVTEGDWERSTGPEGPSGTEQQEEQQQEEQQAKTVPDPAEHIHLREAQVRSHNERAGGGEVRQGELAEQLEVHNQRTAGQSV